MSVASSQRRRILFLLKKIVLFSSSLISCHASQWQPLIDSISLSSSLLFHWSCRFIFRLFFFFSRLVPLPSLSFFFFSCHCFVSERHHVEKEQEREEEDGDKTQTTMIIVNLMSSLYFYNMTSPACQCLLLIPFELKKRLMKRMSVNLRVFWGTTAIVLLSYLLPDFSERKWHLW